MLKSPLLYFASAMICAVVLAAQPVFADTVAGTLISVSTDGRHISVKDGIQTRSVEVGRNTKIFRGQVSKTQQEISLKELAPGDRILATTSSSGQAETVRASYAIVVGYVLKTVGRKIVFKQGEAVFLRKEAQVVLASGKSGFMSDIKPGYFVICRLEPVSKECWTAVVSGGQVSAGNVKKTAVKTPVSSAKKQGTETKSVISKLPTNVKSGPRISGVNISSSTQVRTGDIISIEMKGTPGGMAKAEIRGIAGPVQLKEISAGVYHGALPIRTKNTVNNAVVTCYLTIKDKFAVPFQAKERISLNSSKRLKLPVPEEKPKVDLTPIVPVQPQPVPVPVPEPPKPPEIAPIVVTVPVDGADVSSGLLVKGTAQAEDSVEVNITYTNGKTGFLRIAGDVVTQLVGVTKDGNFSLGPITLGGIYATRGLQFTITVKYNDHPEKPVETRVVFGRN